ncbi:cysteine hydrolase [Paracidovorax anthurii]|uniref:Nicotinamidase-related amidase n=1 Tax=Paracidovorax anthurii TaxID=78229 RepID=A0A328Z2B1_9BURK|nr:cysteine hydrolase [Paracidovorax anthurii]RAR80311.1 nicotinamidase-related amidase [Paracidovorax anthurii]
MTSPAPLHLLAIDPQNDFCDLPEAWCPADPLTGRRLAPALPVAGAHADLRRLAGFIRRAGDRIGAVTVTLDSHQRHDVAHPPFWQARGGAAVPPFTPITAAQVRAGDFAPRDATALPRVLDYLDALEARGRYTLMVWPVHCEIGGWGHGVHADVLAACAEWQAARGQAVHAVFKGMNPWTEHYSAIQAEVPDPQDPATALNRPLLERLAAAERLVIAGEASSHCVRATTEHIVEHLPRLCPGWTPARVVLLTDCMSPVAGFEAQHGAFLDAMRAQGVQLAASSEIAV